MKPKYLRSLQIMNNELSNLKIDLDDRGMVAYKKFKETNEKSRDAYDKVVANAMTEDDEWKLVEAKYTDLKVARDLATNAWSIIKSVTESGYLTKDEWLSYVDSFSEFFYQDELADKFN